MLKNKIAVITGGSTGVGFAIAEKFIREGAKVVVTARTESRLREAEEKLSRHGDVLAIPGDVSGEAQVKELFERTIEKFGKVDILVNNAGTALVKKMVDMTLKEWNEIFSIHSTGTFLCCREAVKDMIKNKNNGKIINISSVSGKTGSPLATAYSAAKAAVMGFSKSLAKEVAPYRINVNSICPGAIDTEMYQKGTLDVISDMFKINRDNLLKNTLSVIPLGRLLNPEEIADMALYLASDKANGITGQSYNVDCGYDIH